MPTGGVYRLNCSYQIASDAPATRLAPEDGPADGTARGMRFALGVMLRLWAVAEVVKELCFGGLDITRHSRLTWLARRAVA